MTSRNELVTVDNVLPRTFPSRFLYIFKVGFMKTVGLGVVLQFSKSVVQKNYPGQHGDRTQDLRVISSTL